MKLITAIISMAILILIALGIQSLFPIDWKWLFVVLYFLDILSSAYDTEEES